MHRWTAEEGRHGIAIRDYLLTTRAVDPDRARAAPDGPHVQGLRVGRTRQDLLRSLAYVSFQELATRVSHRNTGRLTDDPVGDQLLGRVAADENLHMIFYRNLLRVRSSSTPTETMWAIPTW